MSTLDIVAGVQLSEEVRERENKIQDNNIIIQIIMHPVLHSNID